MHPVSPMEQQLDLKETNGYEKQKNNSNKLDHKTPFVNGKSSHSTDKIVLPVEMASMVPLRTLVGKMINKAHADLMTLTDTLPSMSDVERKRQILNYTTFSRKQFLKLMVLVKWAENAQDVQMCQNIMAFLANQNQKFQETVDHLHQIHAELPAARVRNFDILTAVDVLTTGTYQRMPTKIEDMLPPVPLTDEQVLETFEKMNDEIRVRMLTKEVLPSPMRHYRIVNGRVYFCVNNEFEVALTLMGNSDDRKWWIVSLDILVQPSSNGSASDVDISLNENQRQRLRTNAQRQLVPPSTVNEEALHAQQASASAATIGKAASSTAAVTSADSNRSSQDTKSTLIALPPAQPLFFPLVNLYDYLHLFCLNMQLEIIFIQATMMAKTRWLDQLKVHMNSTRTNLTLVYWGGGSPTAQWGSPQELDDIDSQQKVARSTSIEISISNEETKRMETTQGQGITKTPAIAVRDELKGLIQKSGVGASVSLADMDEHTKTKVYYSLKYPKYCLDVLWSGSSDLHTKENLLKSTDMNVERLLLHVTHYHKQSILSKFRQLLKSQSVFLEGNGLHLVDEELEVEETPSRNSSDVILDGEPLIIQYRHDRYIHIDFDSRIGRVKVRETGKNGGDGDVKLSGLEDRLNADPTNIGRHLLWLRSEVVVHEIVSLAKQLNLQPFHPSQMSLRPDDMLKLFGDLPSSPAPLSTSAKDRLQRQSSTAASVSSASSITSTSSTSGVRRIDSSTQQTNKSSYPQHCVFLQFSQFEDWYLVIAVIRNEFQSSLCCLRKSNDQNAPYQDFADLIHVDNDQIWKERFVNGRKDDINLELNLLSRARHLEHTSKDDDRMHSPEKHMAKRRRTMTEHDLLSEPSKKLAEKIDNLSIDLPFLAKLESLSRAFITNRKVELQLHQYRTIHCYTRPFIKSLSGKETRAINHPSTDRMEILCVAQRDLLKTCAYRNVDLIIPPGPSGSAATVNGVARAETLAWVESIAPLMNNEVMLRSSGWWTRGRSQCFVEVQDKVDWSNIPLKTNEISDHISLDCNTSILSFTYTDIDTCVDRFLTDWERIFMMTNISRQISSIWLKKYNDELSFEPCDMKTLTFTYAKDFVCNIKWNSPSKGRSRRYIVDLGTKERKSIPSSNQLDQNAAKSAHTEKLLLPSATKRNPHWRVASFLQDVLNDKRDLVYFIQVLFQTLPLMACLEQLEVNFIKKGRVGDACIIPRASDSVRIMFSSLHGIDIRFQEPSTVCISDAAFSHTFYRTLCSTATRSMPPPAPYIPPSTSMTEQGQAGNNSIMPIKVMQQMDCKPFTDFDKILEDLEDWIFTAPEHRKITHAVASNSDAEDDYSEQPWYISGSWTTDVAPSAIPFDHGLLCSASLCRNVLLKLEELTFST